MSTVIPFRCLSKEWGMRGKEKWKYIKQVEAVMGVNLLDKWAHMAGVVSLDIFKLEKVLKNKYGYRKGSIKDFVQERFGKDFYELIRKAL